MPNYNTLNKDIHLTETSNGYWDITFQNGDLVKAEDKDSLRTGLILACLTSWDYLNKKGNLYYETFGNRAYEELKKKKSSMVEYKIKQYFLEVLNRIRRVQTVESLELYDNPQDPNDYIIKFKVKSINDEYVYGDFSLSTEMRETDTHIEQTLLMSYASNTNPLKADIYLKNEYGVGIPNEVLYIYLKKDNESTYTFIGLSNPTNDDGYVRVTYTPKIIMQGVEVIDDGNHDNCTLKFQYKGDSLYNSSETISTTFKTRMVEPHIHFQPKESDNATLHEGEYVINTKKDTVTLYGLVTETNSATHQTIPLSEASVFIKGSDGRTYDIITNKDGELLLTVPLTQSTTYTGYYGTVKDRIHVNIIPQNIIWTIDCKNEIYADSSLNMTITLIDEFNLPIKNQKIQIIEEIEESIMTLKNGVTDNKGRFDVSISLPYGEHSLKIISDSTPFYNELTIPENVLVKRYAPSLRIQSVKDDETYNHIGENLIIKIEGQRAYFEFLPYPVTIDWGDGTNETYAKNTRIDHDYEEDDEYIITIQGNISTLPRNFLDNIRDKVKEMTLPETITSLPSRFFTYCRNLTTITLTDNIIEIGENCFGACVSLSTLNIPKKLEILNDGAFVDCRNLVNLTFPYTLESIGFTPFNGCDSLEQLTFRSTIPPQAEEDMFYGMNGLCQVYVPEGSFQEYVRAWDWGTLNPLPEQFYEDGILSLDCMVEGVPALFYNEVKYVISKDEQVIYEIEDVIVNSHNRHEFNLSSFHGTYDIIAEFPESNIVEGAESLPFIIQVNEHQYHETYDLNNNQITFTVYDDEGPAKNVRVYVEGGDYSKTIYSNEDGEATFKLPYGRRYQYTIFNDERLYGHFTIHKQETLIEARYVMDNYGNDLIIITLKDIEGNVLPNKPISIYDENNDIFHRWSEGITNSNGVYVYEGSDSLRIIFEGDEEYLPYDLIVGSSE